MSLIRLVILFFLLICSAVQATFASVTVTPLKYEFTIEAWSKKVSKVKVRNVSDSPITLYSSTEDFIAGDTSWTPKFVKPDDNSSQIYSLSSWIKIEDSNVTLSANETREVVFNINVPEWAEPWWHYWAVFFSPWVPTWGQVAVVQRMWILILVNVPWDIKVEWNMSSFSIWVNVDDDVIDKSSFSNFPISFEVDFENTWNIHLKPLWKIQLFDEDGELFKQIWKEAVVNSEGAFVRENLVDYVPINDWHWNVLPKSTRKFISNWPWFWYKYIWVDWKELVKFKNLTDYYADRAAEKKAFLMFYEDIHIRTVRKKIDAVLTLYYEWKNREREEFTDKKSFEVTYTEQYVWLNYYVIAGTSLFVLLLLLYIFVIVPRQKEKLKEQLLAQMQWAQLNTVSWDSDDVDSEPESKMKKKPKMK